LQGSYVEAAYLTVTAAIGAVFICGGIQGFQAGVGDLRRSGVLEWPLRVALVIGGLVLATPGGGIMPLSNAELKLLALAILVPTLTIAFILTRRRPAMA